MKRTFITLLAALCCLTLLQAQPKRELRAAWISTVANIDWPSKAAKGNTELQKAEMLRMLDTIQAMNMNAVIFQIRPTADALYISDLEPWSNWLTGTQGVDNDITYDPLTFTLTEAHKRGIDVHVWLNPYRVTNGFEIEALAKSHIYQQHPEWFVKYGKQWYFEPGLDETRVWLNKVVADIVTRYDIDAIHFDDYFYPYPIAGQEFPDSASFAANPRGFTDKGDWRRNNVNLVIEELHNTIKGIKPWVEFGISPFGIWRNAKSDPERGSATNGLENYDALYADILLWLEKGWIDYVVPQLYWEIGKKVADYQILAHWWAEYTYGQNLYIGHSPYRMKDPNAPKPKQKRGKKAAKPAEITGWDIPNEICRQIALNRTIPEITGSVFFPINSLMRNVVGLSDSLKTDYYRYPSLPPMSHAVKTEPAITPTGLTLQGDLLTWKAVEATGAQVPEYYVVYAFPEGVQPDFENPIYIVGRTTEPQWQVKDPAKVYAVTTINQYKAESLPCIWLN